MSRAGVTVRFNWKEQADLLQLTKFWNRDEKAVLKFAFQQLVLSTKQLSEKLAKGQEEDLLTPESSGQSSEASSPPEQSDSPTAAEAPSNPQ